MSQFPEQGTLQQRSARAVPGEHLELLGKKASSMWYSGSCESLSEAVIETVKSAGLSPEQVKRVIEFANTDAYLKEFKKEGAHKVVDFHLADPSIIFKDLNDGGGGTVFDSGNGDYHEPPKEKNASDFSALDASFASSGEEYSQADPLKELYDIRCKLAAAKDYLSDQIGALEVDFMTSSDNLFHLVKQAALNGFSLGEVLQVMSSANPSLEHIKVAFGQLTPRLVANGVFASTQEANQSIQKTAAEHTLVNRNHPLIPAFSSFCDTLSKLAASRVARAEVDKHLRDTTEYLVKSAKGVIPFITGAARKGGEYAGKGAKAVATGLGANEDVSNAAGNIVGGAVKYSPHAAALVGANEIRRNLKYSPEYQKLVGMTVPMSAAYGQREAEIAGRYGRYPE